MFKSFLIKFFLFELSYARTTTRMEQLKFISTSIGKTKTMTELTLKYKLSFSFAGVELFFDEGISTDCCESFFRWVFSFRKQREGESMAISTWLTQSRQRENRSLSRNIAFLNKIVHRRQIFLLIIKSMRQITTDSFTKIWFIYFHFIFFESTQKIFFSLISFSLLLFTFIIFSFINLRLCRF